MCLEVIAPPAAGKFVQFQPCSASKRPSQLWSFDDWSNFRGTTDGISVNDFCFNLQTPNTAGTFVLLDGCGGSEEARRFSPEATVGAGAAGAAAHQLVNFKQFGRCLDINNFNVDSSFHIVWPCKQAPDPSQVGWNQRWATPTVPVGATSASGTISASNGTSFCLMSPEPTAPMQYVTTVACPAGVPPQNLTWTVYGRADTYAGSYVIEDSAGYCLSPTDPNAPQPDLYNGGLRVSKTTVATCDGSTLQKWNAPPNVLQSMPMKDISED
jgi:hypothetical protein